MSRKAPKRRKKTVRRNIIITVSIVLALIILERSYNSMAKFQTIAEETSYYGIIDAKFTYFEKKKDFDYICSVLEEYYPFFKVNERLNDVDWLKNKSKYKRIIRNTENDTEFIAAMNNILNDLNDKNTFILTGDLYKRFYKHYYPKRRDIFHYDRVVARYNFDGTFELDPNNDFIFHNGPVLDTKVLIKDELAYMRIKAMSYYHVEEDYPKIKNFLKEVEDYDKLIIDIRGNEGGFDEYWEKVVGLLIDNVHSAEYYSFFKQKPKSILDSFVISNDKTIKYLAGEVLDQFPPEIKEDFNFYKRNLVSIEPEGDVSFKGKVYLLVDSEVFSAAEKFAAFAKDTGLAKLVGETTGGGMTFDEIPMAYTPYGGYIICYSRELVMNSDGTINMETKTIPHIVVDDTDPNDDFRQDKCIQAVIQDKI